MRVVSVLFFALLILGAVAWARAPEYDEAYSIFLTAGDPRPAWPQGAFSPSEVRAFYKGDASMGGIAQDLRQGDVHPPLYFWLLELWRRLAGPSWFAARLLSVLLTLCALTCLAWAAALAQIAAAPAMLFALLAYGFAYTGIVARGFALAQALNMLGLALILSAARSRLRPRRLSFTAGLAFGAAGFSNYLAVFPALAAFVWLARQRRRALLPALAGFAAFAPASLYFFLAQRHSRRGQFEPFSAAHAVALLAKDFGAALFGGLPLYAGHAGGIVTAALIVLTVISGFFIIRNWQPQLSLFAWAMLAVPAGLFTLGLVFNNTPIEIRYLAFATPFAAVLLAQTLPKILRYAFMTLQACGIAGLMLAPSTMQPQELAARQIAGLDHSSALILLPFGNDGVGIPGPFIAAAPAWFRLQLIKPGAPPQLVRQSSVILVTLRADHSSSVSVDTLMLRLNNDACWRTAVSSAYFVSFTRTCTLH